MIWAIILLAAICLLAFLIRKATKGTPFEHKCPCTPYIEHLRGIEKDGAQDHRQENLW